MMKTNTLAEERLIVARDRFNRRRKKCKLSFSQIWDRLRRGDTVASIAAAAGVSRSRMRIIYDMWFRKLMRLPKEKERRERQQRKNRKAIAERMERLPQRYAVRKIARAEGNGMVKPVLRDQRTRPGQIRLREIMVGDRLCGVHYLRNIHASNKRNRNRAMYAYTTLLRSTVKRQDCKIFYIETPNNSIKRVDMDQRDLLALFKKRGQQKVTIYFPV
jgi:hypothetical protein